MSPSSLSTRSTFECQQMTSASQLGLIARLGQQMMRTDDYEVMQRLCSQFFSTLQLSGYLRIGVGVEAIKVQFGNQTHGFKRAYMKDLTTYQTGPGEFGGSVKVVVTPNLLYIHTDETVLVVATAGLTDMDVSLLQDNLVIFADMLQAWYEADQERRTLQEALKTNNTELAFRLSDSIFTMAHDNKNLLSEHYSVSELLLTSLMQKFPALGLEPDQENLVLELINSAFNRQLKIIENQIANNNGLCETIQATIENLLHEHELLRVKRDNAVVEEVSAVELF